MPKCKQINVVHSVFFVGKMYNSHLKKLKTRHVVQGLSVKHMRAKMIKYTILSLPKHTHAKATRKVSNWFDFFSHLRRFCMAIPGISH